jgi:hypothetical protein
VEGSLSFSKVIEEHLELKRRNAALNGDMPLERYKTGDPFANHPLFKTEEQARLEETLAGSEPIDPSEELVLAWPTEETMAGEPATGVAEDEDTLWGRSRDFDWGD